MDTQYRKNLKAVAQACKDYTDNSIEKLKWELGTYDLSVTTDSTVAYTKTIPTNTIKGRLNYIGGASKVSDNLIVLNDVAETTTNGITYKVENGVLTYSGTPTVRTTIELSFPNRIDINHAFYFKLFNAVGYGWGVQQGALYLDYSWVTLTFGNDYYTNINNTENTRSTFTKIRFILIEGNTFNNTCKPMLVKGTTAPTEFSEGFENIRSAKTTSVVVSGTDVAPITKAIPQEVLNDVRYGLGFSDTQFNKLDLITKHLTGEWNIVDLGSLDYVTSSLSNTYYTDDLQSIIKKVSSNDEVANILCALYTTTSRNNITTNMTMSVNINGSVHFHNDSYSTVEAFKTAMSGVYLLYQTATQFDVDFSQYIGDDFKNIDTTYMGTITFENEFEYDVPSEIDYLIEEVKA